MQRRAQRVATLALTAAIATVGLGVPATTARAETYEELQQRVEQATATYDEAMANASAIQGEIDENEKRISQIEEEIPEQRERAANSLRTLYKMQQSSSGLVDLILSAEDFNDFIATITYLDRIQSKNMTELEDLAELNAKLLEEKDSLSARKAQADHEAERALQAQQDAIEARSAVVQQALAQAAEEQEEAEAAIAQAAKDAEAGKTFTNASGQEVSVSAPTTTTTPAEATASEQKQEPSSTTTTESTPSTAVSERDAFINKWAPRIDAYNAGYPLGGHGRTFAEAAWDYGVDPRWSPAIACIESTKGLYCFRSHNAWGWGSASWGDWDSAIRSHVAGLAVGYGYTITPSAAQKYCPPNWQDWYSSVSSEMNCI